MPTLKRMNEPTLAPPAPVATATQAEVPRNLNVAAGIVAALLAVTTVFVSLANGGSTSYAIGSGIGSIIPPVILAALIGWKNETRSRKAFIALGVLFLIFRLLAA